MRTWILEHIAILKYAFFSGMTAVIESVIGVLLIRLLGFSEVPANTIGLLIGAVIHYLCVTVHVFKGNVNVRTVAVYLLTFVFGILLQNAVVWGSVHLIGSMLGQELRYLAAKAISLAVSFFCTYFIRKIGYQWSGGSQKRND